MDAMGLSLTKEVSTLTGKPRQEETLAAFVSALVTFMVKDELQWTGCPLLGVMRTPMLVGTIKEYFDSFLN
jgi:hypothetical protein